MATFDGYSNTVDFALLVALAEGGETPKAPEYVFGGRRKFYPPDQPFYARIDEPEDPEE